MMAGYAMLALASIFPAVPGALLVRRCAHPWQEFRISAGICLFLAQIATAVAILGSIQQLRPLPLFVTAVVFAVLSTILVLRLDKTSISTGRFAWPWLLLLPVLFRDLLHVWLFPPYVWDTLSYHLVNVAQWVQSGGFVPYDTPATNAWFPAGFGWFQTWLVLFPGHDGLVELAGLPFFLLMLLGVAMLGRAVGLGDHASAFCAVLAGTTPALMQHSVSANNDIAIAGLLLLMFVALVPLDDAPFRTRRNILAFCFFLGMSIKPYMAFALPGIAVFAWWNGRRGVTPFLSWFPREPASWLLCLGSLALGLFFYVRNFIWFGNPLHPVGLTVGDASVFGDGQASGQRGSFSLVEMSQALHQLFTEKIWDATRIYPDLARSAGWGWVLVALFVPALVVVIWKGEPRLRVLIISGFLSVCGILFGVSHDNTNSRFLIWFPALLVVAVVWITCGFTSGPRRRILIAWLALGSGLNALGSFDLGRLEFNHWKQMAWIPFADRSAAVLTSFGGKEFEAVLNGSEAGEGIYVVAGNYASLYPLYGSDFSRQLVFRTSEAPTEFVSELRKRELRHLYVATRKETRCADFEEVMAGLESTDWQHVQGGYYVLRQN